jgi:hypothetical protein
VKKSLCLQIKWDRLQVSRGAFASAVALVILTPGMALATESPHERVPRPWIIVASDVYLLATPSESAATIVEAMSRMHQPQAIGGCCGGAWRVHFAALLQGPSGEETLDLEFYEVSSSGRPERRTHVFSSQVTAGPADTTISIDDFVISTDLGFPAGHKYEVSLWRPVGSNRNALAEGFFTLE